MLLADWHPPPAVSSSEQPGPVQVLLTPNQEEEEDQATPNQDAALEPDPPPPPYRPAPPRPPLTLSIPHPYAPSRRGAQEEGGCMGGRGEEGEDGSEGSGVRLCELLQAGGVSVRPLGKHLAISLPSLPLHLWDTHTTHTAHCTNLEPPHTHPPPPPFSPPPSPPLEASGQRKPLPPVWQPPQPYSPAGTTYDSSTRHWSSWSLDRPDAVVTPYDTPPDRCVTIRPQTSSQNYAYSFQPFSGNYGSQRAPGQHGDPCCDREEAELSELDSLYQASLQAGRTGAHIHTHSHSQLTKILSGCCVSSLFISCYNKALLVLQHYGTGTQHIQPYCCCWFGKIWAFYFYVDVLLSGIIALFNETFLFICSHINLKNSHDMHTCITGSSSVV